MATAAQNRANYENAQHSTGPKTEAGKAASSVNHTQHGLSGAFTLLPGEDENAYRELCESLKAEHQPATITEAILVQKMAQHYWSSQRAHYLQEACFHPDAVEVHFAKLLNLYMRYQTTHERAFHKCLNQLLKLRAEKRKEQIGFESQKQREAAEEANETRKQEAHQAKTRLINSKAALTELDASLKGTLQAVFPGHTAIPFDQIQPFLQDAIQNFVNYQTAKAA